MKITIFLKNLFSKPKENTTYRPSGKICSKWILIDGPSYADNNFFGNFIVEAEQILEWANSHNQNTWTNQKNVQCATELFPRWLACADIENEELSHLDIYQRNFLKPHISTFIKMKCFKVYCPECQKNYSEIIDATHNTNSIDKNISWTEEYLCPEKHLLYRENQSIRIF